MMNYHKFGKVGEILELILPHLPSLAVVINDDDKIELINPPALASIGEKEIEAIGASFFEKFFNPDDRHLFKERLFALDSAEQTLRTPITRSDNQSRIVVWNACVTIENEHLTLFFGEDITEQDTSEQSLFTSNLIKEAITSQQGIFVAILDFTLTFSQVYGKLDILPNNPKKILGKTIIELLPDEFGNQIFHRYKRALDGEIVEWEDWIPEKDEYFSCRAVPVRNHLSDVIGVLTIHQNITQRRRSMERVAKSESRYSRLVNLIDEVVFELDPQGDILFINQKGKEILQVNEEILGKPLLDFVHPEDKRQKWSLFRAYVTNENSGAEFTCRFIGSRGTESLMGIKLHIDRDECYEVTGIIGVGRDLSEKQALEDRLMQSQRMESIGMLAGGIAHDFNNILAAIIGFGDLAVESLEADHEARPFVERMLESAEHGDDLTKQLLNFSRKDKAVPHPVPLNAIVKQTARILERTIPQDVKVELRLTDLEDIALIDPSRARQALMNLCLNARDAMPYGGNLFITTYQQSFEESDPVKPVELEAGNYVVVSITDTGIGMDEATIQKIWEPFYTTKEPGRGTGLGLAMVYGIMQAHKGIVSVNSKPAIGSTFRLFFRAADVTDLETEIAAEE